MIFVPWSPMSNLHDDPSALKALQDDIYRERVLRARQMSVAEPWLTSSSFQTTSSG